MILPWTRIDTGENPGLFNMQFDEMLAGRVLSGETGPTLRFYRWKPWAISLGHHQSPADIDQARCAEEGIDVVRRPTGGRAILHAEELTYSVVMHAEGTVLGLYNEISRALVQGLRLFGVQAEIERVQPDFATAYRSPSSMPCFASSARYEIEWQGRKLVGSAQRRYGEGGRNVVLQHGSILAGPAHRRLVRFLRLEQDREAENMERELARRTVDLSEITGDTVDIAGLAECIRLGFETAWGIHFNQTQGTDYAPLKEIGYGRGL